MFVSATDSDLNVEIKEHSLLESFFVHVIIIVIIFSTISSTDEPSCLTDPLQTELMLHRGQRSVRLLRLPLTRQSTVEVDDQLLSSQTFLDLEL